MTLLGITTFDMIVTGFLALIAISVFFIGISYWGESRRKSKAGESTHPRFMYLFLNRSSASNSRILDSAKNLIGDGYAVISQDLDVDVDEREGGIVEILFTDREKPDA